MFGWMVETTIVAALLAALAALVGRSGRLGPASRHALWLVVLLKLLTPPLVRWPIGIESSPAAQEEPATTAVVVLPYPSNFEGPTPTSVLEGDGAAALLSEVESSVSDDRPAEVAAPSPSVTSEWVATENWSEPEERPTGWLCDRGKRLCLGLGLAGTLAMAGFQLIRMVRFQRRLRECRPVPGWLDQQIRELAATLRVRPPRALIMLGAGSPLLWCLGRPRLLIPEPLLRGLSAEKWRGIIAHELAHLRRGDPWVRRLELLAGLLWWWNPLYWIVRH
ncbi:MAG: M56 family metallopeptidase, partial [Isosphaeraceae bacterium]|nr:M56 family metallopeptidase [Isosphaeraceae bacterium]